MYKVCHELRRLRATDIDGKGTNALIAEPLFELRCATEVCVRACARVGCVQWWLSWGFKVYTSGMWGVALECVMPKAARAVLQRTSARQLLTSDDGQTMIALLTAGTPDTL